MIDAKIKEGELLKMKFEMEEKDRAIAKLESSEMSLKEEINDLKLRM